MLEHKRKYERFNLPLVVSFRPTYGATDYTVGLLKNFSSEGLALEAENFSFIRFEHLELKLQFPQGNESYSLSGNVIWKKQSDDKCMAGVRFNTANNVEQNELFEKISFFGNIPIDRLIPGNGTAPVTTTLNAVPEGLPQSRKKKRSMKKVRRTGFSKQYFHGGSKCKVTFRLPNEAATDAKKVTIVGDFNDWDTASTTMKQGTRGDYLITIELKSNMDYRFKYLIDGQHWENDWEADSYIANDVGSEDSVVSV